MHRFLRFPLNLLLGLLLCLTLILFLSGNLYESEGEIRFLLHTDIWLYGTIGAAFFRLLAYEGTINRHLPHAEVEFYIPKHRLQATLFLLGGLVAFLCYLSGKGWMWMLGSLILGFLLAEGILFIIAPRTWPKKLLFDQQQQAHFWGNQNWTLKLDEVSGIKLKRDMMEVVFQYERGNSFYLPMYDMEAEEIAEVLQEFWERFSVPQKRMLEHEVLAYRPEWSFFEEEGAEKENEA
ncbi:MAG: hypothetical protein AAFY71_17510 [Bacteroidota bacterium]